MRDRAVVLINRSIVTGNDADGILLGPLSMLESSNAPNTMTNNRGWGLTCAASARYVDYSAFDVGQQLGQYQWSVRPGVGTRGGLGCILCRCVHSSRER
jgi:hypothetical protein